MESSRCNISISISISIGGFDVDVDVDVDVVDDLNLCKRAKQVQASSAPLLRIGRTVCKRG